MAESGPHRHGHQEALDYPHRNHELRLERLKMLRENHLLQLLLGLVVFAHGANLPTHLPLPDRLLHVFNDITYRILLHCKRPALRQYGLMLILGKDVQV